MTDSVLDVKKFAVAQAIQLVNANPVGLLKPGDVIDYAAAIEKFLVTNDS
jgi:hypothetical protein